VAGTNPVMVRGQASARACSRQTCVASLVSSTLSKCHESQNPPCSLSVLLCVSRFGSQVMIMSMFWRCDEPVSGRVKLRSGAEVKHVTVVLFKQRWITVA
jgi:hypothetical protein